MLLLHLLKWLKQNTKHDIRVVVRGKGPLVESFESLGETHVVETAGFGEMSKLRRAMNRVWPQPKVRKPHQLPESWKNKRVDLIYSNTITNGELVQDILQPGQPVITHVHEMDYWIKKSGPENLQKVKAHTTRYIAASRAVKSVLEQNYSIHAGMVDVVHEFIPNTIPIRAAKGEIRKQLGIPPHAFIVAGSGMESWRKGRDLFVQLAIQVQKIRPLDEFHFVWVGANGDKEDADRLAFDAMKGGVSDRIHWTGEVHNPEDYFCEIDTFAMVSREDPFPLVCLESALLGKPVICFADAGGIPEIVEEDAGFVVPYLDVHELAKRVIELKDQPALANQLGERARNKVLERHTVEKAGPQVLEIIERQLAAITQP